jgi:flavorubredoxin
MNRWQQDELDYSGPVQIADNIYWVGFSDEKAGIQCHPYLIMEGSEAVLIDGGSRDDFSTVMLKILRTGADPRNIKRLIYQHYDPDLCAICLTLKRSLTTLN